VKNVGKIVIGKASEEEIRGGEGIIIIIILLKHK
jgi:hypothetical protein